EGDARAEHVDEREALVLDGRLEEALQVPRLAGEALRDEPAPGGKRQGERADRILRGAVRRRLGDESLVARRRRLTGREAVDVVVHHDVGDVDIAPAGVDEVPDAD